MKPTLTLILGSILFTGVLAQLTPAVASKTAVPQEVEEVSPLVEAMEILHDNERIMKKALKGEGDFAKALVAVVGMQDGAQKAKVLTPPMMETLDAPKRAAFLKGYRLEMIAMTKDLLDLEVLILENKLEESRTKFREVRDHEGVGHERYSE
jgi:hypothetical protein